MTRETQRISPVPFTPIQFQILRAWRPGSNRRGPALAMGGCVLLALAMVGCGGYSSKNMAYTTPTQTTSQAFWVANGTNVVEFAGASLTASGSGSLAPALIVNSSFGAPRGVVFDTAANLWVIDSGTLSAGGAAKPALYEFTSSNLAGLQTGSNATASVAINSQAFVSPQQAVFDSKGDLWVSDSGSNMVLEFSAAQLMASGTNVIPNIMIQSRPAFSGAVGIAFDSSGDLWVANNGGTTIFEFNASALPTASGSATLTPNIVLSDDGQGSLQAPWALAFDGSGNLWCSNSKSSNTVVEFAKANLAATGSPTPTVTISNTMVAGNDTLNSPNGIAFDHTGDLAVVSAASPFGVDLYSSSQLMASGSVAPTAFIVGPTTTLKSPAGGNFGPTITYGSSGGGTYMY